MKKCSCLFEPDNAQCKMVADKDYRRWHEVSAIYRTTCHISG